MDKIKMIKALVFVLTFFIVFVLCFLFEKVIGGKSTKTFDIKLEGINSKIDSFKISDKYIYVMSSDKLYVIDVENGIYKGSISVKGENNYGKRSGID